MSQSVSKSVGGNIFQVVFFPVVHGDKDKQ